MPSRDEHPLIWTWEMCVSVCVLFFLFFSFLFLHQATKQATNGKQRRLGVLHTTSLSLANEILIKGEGICLEAPTDVRSDLYRTKELGPLFGSPSKE